MCIIVVSNKFIDHNITLMELTLVENIFGLTQNIGDICIFAKNKWDLKGKVYISFMPKGFLYFSFSYKENIDKILYGGPWVIGRASLSLQWRTTNLDLNDSFFKKTLVWFDCQNYQ